jgi:hypothetical protein
MSGSFFILIPGQLARSTTPSFSRASVLMLSYALHDAMRQRFKASKLTLQRAATVRSAGDGDISLVWAGRAGGLAVHCGGGGVDRFIFVLDGAWPRVISRCRALGWWCFGWWQPSEAVFTNVLLP